VFAQGGRAKFCGDGASTSYRQIAQPFDWTFTRQELDRVLAKIADRELTLQVAA
jgi:hypothetical protein